MADIEHKGKVGETAMNAWLKSNGLSYVFIDQSVDTFASLFKGNLKRPDFLILLESIGLIAVDVKNYAKFDDMGNPAFTLRLADEVRLVLAFERLFRIPVWYAYYTKPKDDEEKIVWYWISALKALEVGTVRAKDVEDKITGEKTKEEFLVIRHAHCQVIEANEDLGKLYTQRLTDLKKVVQEPS